ncbi:transposase [Nocardia pseudovaccinii]|uniref:transposase n=1 Tax=Nocardia pseudovaccinii TaxID=189540 RepID=UPI003D8D4B4C
MATARTEAIRQARRIGDLDHQLEDNRQRLDALLGEHAPELLALPGVGAVVAAVILTVWSHPGRIKTEAALAKIAGTRPIPASSGNMERHQLSRGGDRRLNRAIHIILVVLAHAFLAVTDPKAHAGWAGSQSPKSAVSWR